MLQLVLISLVQMTILSHDKRLPTEFRIGPAITRPPPNRTIFPGLLSRGVKRDDCHSNSRRSQESTALPRAGDATDLYRTPPPRSAERDGLPRILCCRKDCRRWAWPRTLSIQNTGRVSGPLLWRCRHLL